MIKLSLTTLSWIRASKHTYFTYEYNRTFCYRIFAAYLLSPALPIALMIPLENNLVFHGNIKHQVLRLIMRSIVFHRHCWQYALYFYYNHIYHHKTLNVWKHQLLLEPLLVSATLSEESICKKIINKRSENWLHFWRMNFLLWKK